MKISRKLIILFLAALLSVSAALPTTFSWFDHSETATGDIMQYSRTGLPLSIQSTSSAISMTTYSYNKETKKRGSTTSISSASYAADGEETCYETDFTNPGSKDVYVDFNLGTVKNVADFYIGTTSPTVNKKSYTTRASKNSVDTAEKTRIYFETATASEFGFQDNTFWQSTSGKLSETNMNNKSPGDSGFSSFNYDMNIGYYITENGTEKVKYACMDTCSYQDTRNNVSRNVYYYDIPASSTKIFFCCKWYFRTTSNQEQNRTRYIENPTPGTLYYLTGKEVDGKVKAYSTTTSVKVGGTTYNNKLLNLKKRYTSVRMAIGQSVNLGLEEDEYQAKSIAYAIQTNNFSPNSSPTLTKEGIFSSNQASGSGTVRTTITSPLNDTMTADTSISIPTNIDEMPIMQNVKVEAGKTVTVKWYVKNEGTAATTVNNIFFTI